MPVLTGIVRDVAVPTFCAGGHVPAECLCPAGLDRRHDLELAQADMPGIGPSPRRPMGTKDISDLQLRPGHPGGVSLQPMHKGLILQLLQALERADGVADYLCGDMGISGSRAQLGVAEQNLDHPYIRVGLQKVRGE